VERDEFVQLLANSSINFFIYLYDGIMDTRYLEYLKYVDERLKRPIFVVRTKMDKDMPTRTNEHSETPTVQWRRYKDELQMFFSHAKILDFKYEKENVYVVSGAKDAKDIYELDKLTRDCVQLAESLQRRKSSSENYYETITESNEVPIDLVQQRKIEHIYETIPDDNVSCSYLKNNS
jgi:hypothetical protein